jgi:hypothetical protein
MKEPLRHTDGSSEVQADGCSFFTQVPSAAVATVYLAQEEDLRVVDDGIQWVVQRHVGGRWRDDSYHRSRRLLIERLGVATSGLEALPEFHSQPQSTDWPRCHVCGRIKSKPTIGLPRQLFCIGVGKASA